MNRYATFWSITLKTAVVHTVSYFVMGLLAYTLFDYTDLYANSSLNLLMRQTSEPLVMAGPLFQPIRGLLFGLAFYLLRPVMFARRGWLKMWGVLIIIGILSPFGPAPGSIEGLIFTVLPLSAHFTGQIEVYLQSLLLSAGVFYWVTHPRKKWLSWALGLTFTLALVLPVMGLLMG